MGLQWGLEMVWLGERAQNLGSVFISMQELPPLLPCALQQWWDRVPGEASLQPQPPFMQLKGFASERLNYLWISRAVPTRVCSAARPFCWMSCSFAPAERIFSWGSFGSRHLEEVLGWLGRNKPCE